MSNYLIKTPKSTKKIVAIKIGEGYTFFPKKSPKDNFTSVTLFDKNKINNIIAKKLIVKYQRILTILADIENSSDNADGDYMILLDELTRLKELIEFKYKKLLKQELYNEFMANLDNLKGYIELKYEASSLGMRR